MHSESKHILGMSGDPHHLHNYVSDSTRLRDSSFFVGTSIYCIPLTYAIPVSQPNSPLSTSSTAERRHL